ncbi:MAG: hypothetical protein ABFS41_17055 [Myxococcota bacterium]
MRKVGLWILAVAVALPVFYFGLAESAEVVVLETAAADGTQTTRLWVVDHEGHAWLRTGDPSAAWLARLRANPEVVVTRAGQRQELRAVLVDDAAARDAVNQLTLEKYGWRERVLRAAMMDPAGVQPIRLEVR